MYCTLTSLMTLVAFFVHLGVGCCGHDAHASEVHASEKSADANDHVHHQWHGYYSAAPVQHNTNDRCPCEDREFPCPFCSASDSVYVVSPQIKAPSLSVTSIVEAGLAAFAFSANLQVDRPIGFENLRIASSTSAAPLRVLLQTWLL